MEELLESVKRLWVPSPLWWTPLGNVGLEASDTTPVYRRNAAWAKDRPLMAG